MKKRFETFTVLITKVNRNVRKIKNQAMADYGLRSPHISCLYYLYLNTSLTATALSELCEEDKSTISRSLEYLEGCGYLTCESKFSKKYNSLITLTEKGREVGEKIFDKVNIILDELDKELTEEDRINFYRSFSVISDIIERIASR